MPYTKLQDLPTKENVVTEPKQVVVKPIMAKPNAINYSEFLIHQLIEFSKNTIKITKV